MGDIFKKYLYIICNWISKELKNYIYFIGKGRYQLDDEIAHANISKMAVMSVYCIIIFLFSLCTYIADIINYGRCEFSYIDIIFGAVIIFYIILIILCTNSTITSIKLKQTIYISYWYIINFGIMFFVYNEISVYNSLYYYIVAMLIFSFFPLMSLFEIIFIILFDACLSIVFINKDKNFMFLAEVIFISSIITLFISQKEYIAFIKNKIIQMKLTQLSENDTLTGLLNRRGLEDRLDTFFLDCKTKNKYIYALMLDIDFFKNYNDTYGHLQGDECLRIIAESIKNTLESKTNLVIRYGGEEFVAVIAEYDDENVLKIAKEIKEDISNKKIKSGKGVCNPYLTISIGIAKINPNKESSISNLIDNADSQLYLSKNNGRDAISFEGKVYTK